MLVNGTVVTFKIDTEAKANLINEKDLKALADKPKTITNNAMSLKAYNNQPIKTIGGCKLKVTAKGKLHNLMFTIVPNGHELILGDEVYEDLGLVKRIYQINSDSIKMDKQGNSLSQIQGEESTHSSVFKGHGTLPYSYKIQLKENAIPVVHAPRRVPAPLKASLKKELKRMTQMGVIERVEEPTDWVNSITLNNAGHCAASFSELLAFFFFLFIIDAAFAESLS